MAVTLTRDGNGQTTVVPTLVLGYDSGRNTRSVLHTLMSGIVVAVLYDAQLRVGTLQLFFASAADADRARTLHATAGVWQLTDPDNTTENMRYVVTGGQLRKYQTENRARWILEVPYGEVS